MAKVRDTEEALAELETKVAEASQFPEENVKELVGYLASEIKDVEGGEENSAFFERVNVWRRQREARPEKKTATYPWPGAANTCPPLAAIKTNGVYAKAKGAFTRKPLWSVVMENADQARALENYFNAASESDRHFGMKAKMDETLYDWASIGTEFIALPWVVDEVTFKKSVSPGVAPQEVTRQSRNSVAFMPQKIENVVTRAMWADIQRSPWIAVKYQRYMHELRLRERQGIYTNVDLVVGNEAKELPENISKEYERGGLSPNLDKAKVFNVYEVYCKWDINKDGAEVELILTIELESRTCLRIEYNPIGLRPIARMPYLDTTGTIYGIGIGWMMENLQEVVTTLHNMGLNSLHLAHLPILAAKRGSGLGPNEILKPLKLLFGDNPREDFYPFMFPDVSANCFMAERLEKDYADQYSSATDYSLGHESRLVGTKATMGGTMFLANQSQTVLTAIMERVEQSFSEIGTIMFYQLVANKELVDFNLVSEADREPLKAVLDTPIEKIPEVLAFKVKMTDVDKTENAKRQNLMAFMQMYTMYGDKMMQYLMMASQQQQQVPPQVQEFLATMAVGSTRLMEKMLEFIGERDGDDYLPFMKDTEFMLEQMDIMRETQLKEAKSAAGTGFGGGAAGMGNVEEPGVPQGVQGAGGIPGGGGGPAAGAGGGGPGLGVGAGPAAMRQAPRPLPPRAV